MMLLFFFNETATTEIYTYCHTLSLHDALPISSGVASVTGPATSTTSAPRRAAAAATAKPILPLLRLPMKRTGSMSSKVGPALTTMRRPASALPAAEVIGLAPRPVRPRSPRSEEHTSELQTLMRH